ncbi:MAG: SDR family oxidoreductase [Alphaproteobacteria bacterium]|nr:SDR family oxidoreductase [Alphaproteobacteria bacterium]
MRDLSDRAVLITGGTAGIGLATGLAFAKRGARVTLTCRWGSAEPDEILARFETEGARRPSILEANVTDPDDLAQVLAHVAESSDHVDTFVSNVGFAQLVRSLDDYNLRGLQQSIEYSAWPLASHLLAIRERFGRLPRHAVALSSCGIDAYYSNYDFAGAAKAVLETLVRYLAHRVFDEDCRINAVRARFVDTDSLTATVGPEFTDFVDRLGGPGFVQTPDEVAGVVLALCSGWLDGMRGQVLTVDHGTAFYDNLMRLHATRTVETP